MNLVLYTNNSENEKLNKSLTTLQTVTGTLKESTSIINPVIKLSGVTIANVVVGNYAYISEFGRYYFIKDVVSINDNLWEYHLHVDVLSSFKTQIRNLTCVIKRQEGVYNLYLDDENFKSYQNPQILTKTFPNGFTEHSYILLVSGG